MPQSKKNKDRTEKVNQFKNKQKQKFMSENTNTTPTPTEQPPVRQIVKTPYWAADAEFTLTGVEFMKLNNFMDLFKDGVQTMQEVFLRNVDSGTIQSRFHDRETNEEVSEDEVREYMAEMQKYLAQKHAQPEEVPQENEA